MTVLKLDSRQRRAELITAGGCDLRSELRNSASGIRDLKSDHGQISGDLLA